MRTWAPLFSTLPTSTLWSESKEVRILFLTCLAAKDKDGIVTATTSGLSRLANLTYEETVEALKVLEAPDTKTDVPQEFEGRRLSRVEGGFLVLNHLKYREMVKTIKRKQAQADWQADYRARKKDKKPSAAMQAKYDGMERRAVEAAGNGDNAAVENIAAESLPQERWP